MSSLASLSALQAAAAVADGSTTAVALAEAAIEAVKIRDPQINAFTCVTAERALAEAAAIDAQRRVGARLPPLAGVPYAVKNLFDIEGVVTLAGSKINCDRPPARRDSAMVERMRAAGAVLVGALNMDEYAFGFTTENSHYGATRNPHDTSRIAGGSSGGSAAAVAARMVPVTLGTDTNGSIRVPASLNGIFGLKPTYGRLSRRGAYLFVASLDHVGPFARDVRDLAAVYDALQGPDALDAHQAPVGIEPAAPALSRGRAGLRVGVAAGYFEENATAHAREALAVVADALKAGTRIDLPEVARARAAAFVITAAEGSQLHLSDLCLRASDFDPLIRDRFLANALTPAAWLLQAQRFRRWFLKSTLAALEGVDLLLAAATPLAATPIGDETFEINGTRVPARPSMGLLTQPLSFLGLPIVTVPVCLPGRLPIGVQIIAKPWREAEALRAAAWLEDNRVVVAAPPPVPGAPH
ncbi:MAG: AtzE family amidohydrolase [Burkholderiales bacterium]